MFDGIDGQVDAAAWRRRAVPDDPTASFDTPSEFYPEACAPNASVGLFAGDSELPAELYLDMPVRQPTGVRLPAPLPPGAEVPRRRTPTPGQNWGLITTDELATILVGGYTPGIGTDAPVAADSVVRPLEVYVATHEVSGVADRVWHYNPFTHCLESLVDGPTRPLLARHTPMPELIEGGAATVVVTTTMWQQRTTHGLRAYQSTLMECGRATQSMALAATALNIPATCWTGLFDRTLNDLLGLDGSDEVPLHYLSFSPHPH